MNKLFVYSMALLSFLITACEDESTDNGPASVCDRLVILDKEVFLNIDSDALIVTNAIITEDCLEITVSASGCDGSAWQVELVDADSIEKTSPVQRTLKLALENPEDCTAVVSIPFSFDLRSLRTQENEIVLNLLGWKNQLTYTY